MRKKRLLDGVSYVALVAALIAIALGYQAKIDATRKSVAATHSAVIANKKAIAANSVNIARTARARRQDCLDIHRFGVVLESYLNEQANNAKKMMVFPGLTAAQRAALQKSEVAQVAGLRRLVMRLKKADCGQ